MTHTLFGEPVEILEYLKYTRTVKIRFVKTGEVHTVPSDALIRIPGAKPKFTMIKGGQYVEPKPVLSDEPLKPQNEKSLSEIVDSHKLDDDKDPKGA